MEETIQCKTCLLDFINCPFLRKKDLFGRIIKGNAFDCPYYEMTETEKNKRAIIKQRRNEARRG